MKATIKTLLLPASLATIMVACSSGGDLAGIGGSGFVSTGTVTGFGSVFVNGVEFETNASTFELEDASGSESDLRIGMVVQVSGTINADGVTGTATAIRYGDELEGPIANTSADPNTGETSFDILGINVVASTAETAFEDMTMADLADGKVIEVSGFFDNSDVLRATYIELKSNTSSPTTQFEIKGTITGLSGTSFTLRGVNVNAAAANLEDLPNGLQNDLFVEVKGTYDTNTSTLNATRVEGEDYSYDDDGREVSIEGYITRYVSDSDFDINGYPVNAGSASKEPATLQLGEGIKVEVEGVVVNGVLIADEVETRGGNAEVSALVGTKDAVSNSFTVLLAGQPLTVQLTTSTQMEDENDGAPDDFLSFSEITTGDYVQVRGFETDTNTITATRVKRDNDEDPKVQLQGVVTQADVSSLTILGVSYTVNGGTHYENESDATINNTQFLSAITLDQSIVKIEEDSGDGDDIADEVDIEQL